jgi:DNA-binding SARP family transcriptional activator
MESQTRTPVLLSEISRLSPDIFSHPIWIYFGRSPSLETGRTIQALLDSVHIIIPNGDHSSACQLLLVCAVLQNRIHDQDSALDTTHKVLDLAERNRLPQVECWALWALAALSFQRRYFQNTIEHLNHLKERLHILGEWTLANVIDLICQYIQQYPVDELEIPVGDSSAVPADPLLLEILDSMKKWGTPNLSLELDQNGPGNQDPHHDNDGFGNQESGSFPGSKRWRKLWRTLQRAAKGELRLQWVETNGQEFTQSIDHLHETSSISSTDLPSFEVPQHEMAKTSPTKSLSPVSDSPLLQSDRTKTVELFTPALASPEKSQSVPSFVIYFLGSFKVYKNDRLIENWLGNKSKQIFKYLVNHRQLPVHRDILVDLFWPDVDPEVARRNLYQAIYSLRLALQNNNLKYPYILTEENHYSLNSELDLLIDSEEFRQHYLAAQILANQDNVHDSIKEYELAENLYQGEFLADDRYEDWPVVQRENLRHDYLHILDQLSQYYFDQGQFGLSVNYCQKILAEDNCREDAYQKLMRCYLRQGQHHLALRQYHLCVETLKRELDVPPMQTTVDLFQEIKKIVFNFQMWEN